MSQQARIDTLALIVHLMSGKNFLHLVSQKLKDNGEYQQASDLCIAR